MRGVAVVLVAIAALGVVSGCSKSIADINARPERFYEKKIDFRGQLTRRQDLPGETLLEVASRRGARILVKGPREVEAVTGDWVRVRGILVPETRVGDKILYDVVAADEVTRVRAPRLPEFM
jgi:uncharacterized membrane protein YcgQ (UPF0703/DUF1980 family)